MNSVAEFSSIDESSDWAYPPSWLDSLTAWLERLPAPIWLAYVVLFLLLIVINTAAFWVDGSLMVGTFDVAHAAEATIAIFLVPFVHYLDKVAETALSEFRPILPISDKQYSVLSYELTTLSRRQGLVAIAIGVPLGVASVLGDPGAWGLTDSSSAWLTVYRSAIGAVLVALALTFLLHTIHQLRMVSYLQGLPEEISLLQSGPVYALSLVTARTGLGIAFFVYYVLFLNYGLGLFGAQAALSAIDLSVTVLLLMVSVGAFIIPLLGMHDRLVEEKSRALAEANKRIELTVSRLYQQVDSQRQSGEDINHENLTSLLLVAETISKVSTWPWSPQTLRGFFGAIALPVVVWLITTALDRVLLR